MYISRPYLRVVGVGVRDGAARGRARARHAALPAPAQGALQQAAARQVNTSTFNPPD